MRDVEVKVVADIDKTCTALDCNPRESIQRLVGEAAAEAEGADITLSSISVKANCTGYLTAMACGRVCKMEADISFVSDRGEIQEVRAHFEGLDGNIVTKTQS